VARFQRGLAPPQGNPGWPPRFARLFREGRQNQTEQRESCETTMKTDKNSNEHTTKGLCPNPMSQRVPSTTGASNANRHPLISNCRQLRQAIAAGCFEFRILLCGSFYSRKHITLDGRKRFHVFNYIDDTQQRLTCKELFTRSNIGKAMRNGSLVVEGQSHV
jgi:hypothetical protein